mmetsp:Transcript_26532/g.79906  ORF Transcript_26532/g.79906 Transcript_26532/m.79906 type:complete len:232 (-) Transcript_26532:160-855(-)
MRRLHEAQQDHVPVGGEKLADFGHHHLIKVADPTLGVPESVRRLIQRLDPDHRVGSIAGVLEPQDQLAQRHHGPLPAVVVLGVQEETSHGGPLASEALVRRLGPGHGMEVEHRLHATRLQPPERAPQKALPPWDEPIGHGLRCVLQQPIADWDAHVGKPEATQHIEVMGPQECVPMGLNYLPGALILGAAIFSNQRVLVPNTLILHFGGPHPVLHEEPAAQVHAQKGVGFG